MNAELTDVHIGKKILEMVEKRKMSKSEFARLIGVRQQHINRIFESASIDTEKLRLASVALDFNFFTYYVKLSTNIVAEESAISWGDGNATVMIGDAALSAKIKELQATVLSLTESRDRAVEQYEEKKKEYDTLRGSVDEQIGDKKRIIDFMDEKIKHLEKQVAELQKK